MRGFLKRQLSLPGLDDVRSGVSAGQAIGGGHFGVAEGLAAKSAKARLVVISNDVFLIELADQVGNNSWPPDWLNG